jgi:hypothetical protein
VCAFFATEREDKERELQVVGFGKKGKEKEKWDGIKFF